MQSRQAASGVSEAFPRLGRIDLADQAYQAIRLAVLKGVFPTGQTLNTVAVAERLGVSRTPVRQAMKLLAQQGLLDVGTRGQYVVHRMSAEEIREVFVVRAALESVAVRALVQRVAQDAGVLDELAGILGHQRAAVQEGDSWRFLQWDQELHTTFALRAGLPRLSQMLSQLRDLMLLLGEKAIARPGRLVEVLAEHQAILDAVALHQPGPAAQAVIRHLVRTAASVGVALDAAVLPDGPAAD